MNSRLKSKNDSSLSTGVFITFEGTEGSGKTTQCKRLAQRLRGRGYRVLITREPGGTPLAEAIRNLLLSKPSSNRSKEHITPACETLLILAARVQHLKHVIVPALSKGTIVLCDRFFDSTIAYQGYGRNVNIQSMRMMNRFVTGGLEPDLTFLLDLPIEQGLRRRQRSRYQNRIDQESVIFHEQVRKGFLQLARQWPKRIRKMDGLQSPRVLAEQIEIQTMQRLRSAGLNRSPSLRTRAKHHK